MKKINFLRDKDPFRILLAFALFLSLVFNYILYQDQQYSEQQMMLMRHEFIEDVVGYNYCDGGD